MEFPVAYGKYHLLERIAVGGMAEVFLAKAFGVAGFERLLVIKRILPHMAEDREFIDMFVDEARIASTLNHSGIAQILELGQEDAAYFIAMEFIHGRDLGRLQERLRKNKRVMPIPIAVLVVSRLCEALEYAHRKTDSAGNSLRIIHRDVSPGNVLISYDGDVKLIDFGIAKAQNRMGRTTAGTLKGKFGYMSPEQVRGLPLDHRSDIFAAGIILYELLTGERLFAGESDFGTLEKVRNATVTPPSTYNRRIPRELERVVLRALAREPEERYEWASDLQQDLSRYLMFEGSLTTGKSLAAFMRELFAEDLLRENEKLRLYRQRGYPLVNAETTSRVPVVEPPPEKVQATPTVEIASELTTPLRPAPKLPAPDLSDETAKTPAEPAPPRAASSPPISHPRIPASEKPQRGRTGTEYLGRKPLSGKAKRSAAGARPPTPVRKRGRPVLGIVVTIFAIAAVAIGIVFIIPSKSPSPSAPRPSPPAPVALVDVGSSPALDATLEEKPSTPEEPALNMSVTAEPKREEPLDAAAPSVDGGTTGGDAAPPPPVVNAPPTAVPAPVPRDKAASHPVPVPVVSPRPPEPKVAHASFTTLLVSSEPAGAEILVNGRPVGETPGRVEGLDPSRPTFLVVKKKGYRKFIQNVRFEGKAEIEVVARLVPETGGEEPKKTPESGSSAPPGQANEGFLVANSKPWAKVVVDGMDTGRWTPIAAKNPIRLSPGKHRITLVTEDGRKLEAEVEIRAGESTKLIREFP